MDVSTRQPCRIPLPMVKRCLVLLAVASVFVTTPAWSEQGKTILVLDASGSMWQKISDGYKIKIAQQVVGDLLQTIPAEQELGLITYGHRRKGDCSDIELLVEPAPGTREQIAGAVNGLDPKGKTPLSAAVIEAADVLRIEENEATVILLSDGLETCNLDPCAVGTELENRGINFTAHVIGFDVADTAERARVITKYVTFWVKTEKYLPRIRLRSKKWLSHWLPQRRHPSVIQSQSNGKGRMHATTILI